MAVALTIDRLNTLAPFELHGRGHYKATAAALGCGRARCKRGLTVSVMVELFLGRIHAALLLSAAHGLAFLESRQIRLLLLGQIAGRLLLGRLLSRFLLLLKLLLVRRFALIRSERSGR